jgi:hypothetical protein
MLLEVDVGVTEIANDYGFLPLHCACRTHQPNAAIVRSLVEANPSTVRRPTHAGESAVHLANGASVAVLEMLTQAAATADNCDEASNREDNKLMMSKIGNTPCKYRV